MLDWNFTTMEEARSFYRKHRCNGFNIWKDYGEEVSRRFEAAVPNALKQQWSQELFEEYFDIIMRGESSEPFWTIHSRLAGLKERTPESLSKVLLATRKLKDLSAPSDNVLIAETICGRRALSVRGGLIYPAFDLGMRNAAKEFADLALEFSAYKSGMSLEEARCDDAQRLCRTIRKELEI